MDWNEWTKRVKEYLTRFWSWLRPHLIRWNNQRRRIWKKYHVTKVLILSVLVISLIGTSYLFYSAKTTNVTALKAGLEQTTTVYDRNEEEAGTLYAQKGTFVPLEEMSSNIQEAVISTEDKRFYTHRGFDPIGIGRAAVGYVINGGNIVGGGSTITQQLAKNAYLTADQTMIRKLKEVFLAIEIEKAYEKEDILEMYLNNSYFGNGVWGVADASLKYFGKNVSEITVSEAATLAGMLKAPSRYNPIDNYDLAIERRNVVLSLMATNEYISEEEKTTAQQSSLTLVDAYNNVDGYHYPYYFDAVIDEAFVKYGIEEEDLLNNGYKIYTSLNQNHQQQMDALYANDSYFQDASDGTLLQSASVALDPNTGGVTAVVGGRGEYTFRGYNRATHMKRQPGSVMKPLGVFTPALEAGYEVDDMLVDKELSYGDDNYTPTNLYGDYSESGEVPMYEAVANSLNAPTVWLLNEIGLRRGINKVEDFGITVEEGDENLSSIALGGMDGGVSPLQIASAFSVFPNEGYRMEPHFITKIVDATGAVIVDNTEAKPHRVTTPEVAEKMNSMLLGVYSNGTAVNNQPSGYTVAGKTGTTETHFGTGVADQWSVGYTPDLVVTSWMGFDKVTEEHYLTSYSSEGAGELLEAELEAILPHTTMTAFETESAEEMVASETGGTKIIEQLQEGMNKVGEQFKEGADYVRERAGDLFNLFKERVSDR